MNPQLQAFFDSLNTEAAIDQLVNDKREEDLYLEFKEKQDRRTADLGDSDKVSFSKAVSGFANADGGVLIFGVATKKSRNSPDRAAKRKVLRNAEGFRAKLLDSILNTSQPPVDGVILGLIPVTPGTARGYVKCLIPASDRPPHRAMLAGREYWRRTTNGFRRMEHYELEEAFGRRLRPVLRMRIVMTPRADPDNHVKLDFSFLNVGRGVARHAGFHCDVGEGVVRTHGRVSNVSHLNNGRPSIMHYDPTGVVHPNGIFSALGGAVVNRQDKNAPLQLQLIWYAEDTGTRQVTVEVQPNSPLLVE